MVIAVMDSSGVVSLMQEAIPSHCVVACDESFSFYRQKSDPCATDPKADINFVCTNYRATFS
jgi:hypothetical protein